MDVKDLYVFSSNFLAFLSYSTDILDHFWDYRPKLLHNDAREYKNHTFPDKPKGNSNT